MHTCITTGCENAGQQITEIDPELSPFCPVCGILAGRVEAL